MAGHYIELSNFGGTLEIRFVCENRRGDDCHKHHADPDAESWGPDDPLVDTDECWAMTWWDAVGTDGLHVEAANGPLVRVPVEITYDEGIVATPDPAPAGEAASASSRLAGAPNLSTTEGTQDV